VLETRVATYVLWAVRSTEQNKEQSSMSALVVLIRWYEPMLHHIAPLPCLGLWDVCKRVCCSRSQITCPQDQGLGRSVCCLAARLQMISTFGEFQYGFELRVCWQTWVGTSMSDWVLGRSEAFRCEAL
jgi:hypothetical protein